MKIEQERGISVTQCGDGLLKYRDAVFNLLDHAGA